MTDDCYAERPDRPAWAAIPTMPWSRVQPAERRDTGTAPSGPQPDADERRGDEAYRGRRAAPDVQPEFDQSDRRHVLDTEERTDRTFA